jgi:hypothetical protein
MGCHEPCVDVSNVVPVRSTSRDDLAHGALAWRCLVEGSDGVVESNNDPPLSTFDLPSPRRRHEPARIAARLDQDQIPQTWVERVELVARSGVFGQPIGEVTSVSLELSRRDEDLVDTLEQRVRTRLDMESPDFNHGVTIAYAGSDGRVGHSAARRGPGADERTSLTCDKPRQQMRIAGFSDEQRRSRSSQVAPSRTSCRGLAHERLLSHAATHGGTFVTMARFTAADPQVGK